MIHLVRPALILACVLAPAARAPFRLELSMVDAATSAPVACRLHVTDAAGKPQLAPGLPAWRDHVVCRGQAALDLPAGEYVYEVERGPEWSREVGKVSAVDGGVSKVVVTLRRIASLAAEGWWSGDLHIHRPLADAELLADAEDLHVAPVITWWNKTNLWAGKELPEKPLTRTAQGRLIYSLAGEDEREGGALLFYHLPRPLAIQAAGREHPSPSVYLEEAKGAAGAHVDIEKPFWWDVPVWVASGKADTIGLANNHMCRSRMYENEAWGRPRDLARLPNPRGNGFWTQEIYYHLLNCGLRLPPSAGSASGVLNNPVGYNRVYVQVGPELTWEGWWEGLRAGRSFVTNGPLLRVTADGRLPGSVLRPKGEERQLDVELRASLVSLDPIDEVQVVVNGKVERSVPRAELEKSGSLGKLTLGSSGWFLVRAISTHEKTFRFASTAPFYVEAGAAPRRISRGSAKFFVDWVAERRVRMKEADPAKRGEILRFHDRAWDYWTGLAEKANAD